MATAEQGLLVPTDHPLNVTTHLTNTPDNIHQFLTTLYPSSDGCFLQDKSPCNKTQITKHILNLTKCYLYSSSLQSPDLNPTESFWDVMGLTLCVKDVQSTNLERCCHISMDQYSEEYFRYLVNSIIRGSVWS